MLVQHEDGHVHSQMQFQKPVTVLHAASLLEA